MQADHVFGKYQSILSEFQSFELPDGRSSTEDMHQHTLKSFSQKIQEIHMDEAMIGFYNAFFDNHLNIRSKYDTNSEDQEWAGCKRKR